MKTLYIFIVLLLVSFTAFAQIKPAPIVEVEGWTFTNGVAADLHYPFTKVNPTSLLIKGGAGGWDTTAVITMENIDSIHVNIIFQDSVNLRFIGRSVGVMKGVNYYGDTTCIFNGNYAGFTGDVIGSGVITLSWAQIAKAVKPASMAIQFLLYFDTASRLETAGKRCVVKIQKFYHQT